MKISIISIGKFDNSPHKLLFLEYIKRIKWKVELKEIDLKISKNFSISEIKKNESILIVQNIKPNSFLIAMDEKGGQFSSVEFAKLISKFAVGGNSDITFVIGGSEGLSEEILSKAKLKISLGKITLPHLMARSILIEQLYRAQTIIEGHPYHRE